MYEYKYWAHRLISKYIKIKESIAKKVQEFRKKYIGRKKIVGIHLRGTDKYIETPQVDPVLLLEEAQKYKGCHYFIATDDEQLLELAKRMLSGKIIYYNSQRSADGKPVHLLEDDRKALRGEEVLIEVLILSQCTRFIHTVSNVSAAAYFFNPELRGSLFSILGGPIEISP